MILRTRLKKWCDHKGVGLRRSGRTLTGLAAKSFSRCAKHLLHGRGARQQLEYSVLDGVKANRPIDPGGDDAFQVPQEDRRMYVLEDGFHGLAKMQCGAALRQAQRMPPPNSLDTG